MTVGLRLSKLPPCLSCSWFPIRLNQYGVLRGEAEGWDLDNVILKQLEKSICQEEITIINIYTPNKKTQNMQASIERTERQNTVSQW